MFLLVKLMMLHFMSSQCTNQQEPDEYGELHVQKRLKLVPTMNAIARSKSKNRTKVCVNRLNKLLTVLRIFAALTLLGQEYTRQTI